MANGAGAAPKVWRGRFYEDFDVGDVYRSRLGRTDHADRQHLVHLPDAEHEPGAFQRGAVGARPLRAPARQLRLHAGIDHRHDRPGHERERCRQPRVDGHHAADPVFEGDTLWAESEILETRESSSRPNMGIVSMRCRGINQRREVVIEFKRTFMVYKRDAPEVQDMFPGTDDEWTV